MAGPYIFGVRHLSPAAAWHLRRTLDEVRPRLILVEGPSDFSDQMDWMCHPDTVLPAAMLAYTRESPVRTILYPFAVYSPEYQAILWAHQNGVECRFMDLPSSVFLAFDTDEPEDSDETPAVDTPTTEWVYHRLETLSGEAHDTFWERHFEQLTFPDAYRAAADAFGRQLREAAYADAPRRTAENLVREAYMKRTIQAAMNSGIPAEAVFCVCGAYHVAGLENGAVMTDAEEKTLPRVECCSTLMPYSYYRLSTRSGYGAGNKAPA